MQLNFNSSTFFLSIVSIVDGPPQHFVEKYKKFQKHFVGENRNNLTYRKLACIVAFELQSEYIKMNELNDPLQ